MKWVLRIYAIALMVVTGYRTWDFMNAQMQSAGDYSGLLALFFLFATEVGLFLWHEISLSHTTTHEQARIATSLVALDFIGSTFAGIADMILRQTFYVGYTIPPTLGLILVYGLPILVAINVLGFIYYERNDADHQLEQSKKQLKFEITRTAIKELKDNQSQIAESMKKDIYKTLRDEVTGKVWKQYGKEGTPALPETKPISTNGNSGRSVDLSEKNKRSIFMLQDMIRRGNGKQDDRQQNSNSEDEDPKNG